ncbi:hypothetical protein CTM88_19395 [Photobacterium aquimaris]|uniref:Uncharacterized protein n=1 Tax=Photobacterium aquimaris TaxID=512643 RepID=A0A2T3IF37_9GAMM|nr:hypothetical protein [Photobacterium aquimaris]OBU19253.1 hypothetical protein AYY20_04655 [Photobacterium aquimaris]PSU23980.1 hypothetical protein CTM88_19395 [Photobacterium aquimaris]
MTDLHNDILVSGDNLGAILTGCVINGPVMFSTHNPALVVEQNDVQTAFKNNVNLSPTIKILIDQLLQMYSQGESITGLLSAISAIPLTDQEHISFIACKLLIKQVVTQEEKTKLLSELGSLTIKLSPDYEDCLFAGAIIIMSERGDEERKFELFSRSIGELSKQAYICTTDLKDIDCLPFSLDECSIPTLKLILNLFISYGNSDVSSKILSILKARDFVYEYKKEILLLECIDLNLIIGTDYFLLTKQKKEYLNTIIQRVIDFLESNGYSNDLFFIAVQLASYTQAEDIRLLSFLEKHQQELEAFQPIPGINLRILVSVSEQELQDSIIRKSSPEKLAEKIIQNSKDGTLTAIITLEQFSKKAKPGQIKATYKKIKKLEKTPAVILSNLVFLAVMYDHLDESTCRNDIFYLIKSLESEDVFLAILINLSEKLIEKDLSELALMLLKPRFKEFENPWVSPVYIRYLNLLLSTSQYYDLDTRLKLIAADDNLLVTIIVLRAKLALSRGELDESYEYFYQLLDNPNDNSCLRYVWMNLINIRQQQNKDYRDIVSVIDLDVLDDPKDPYSWLLLSEMIDHLDDITDKILYWFVVEPQKYAENIFRFVSSLPNGALSKEYRYSTDSPFIGAFCYSMSGRNEIRLVCSIPQLCAQQGTYLISSDSPLTCKLEKIKCGESFIIGNFGVLREKISPLLGAYRLATELMDMDMNVPFWKGNIDSDPSKVYQSLVDFIESIDTNKEHRETTLASDLSLHFKYQYVKGINSFSQALQGYLSGKVSNYFSLISNNEEIELNDKDIVLDEFGFALIVAIGCHEQLINNNIHITEGTRKSIEGWLFNCGEDSTIYFDKEYDYFSYTNQPILEPKDNLADNVRLLLKRCKIHNDKEFDMPMITILGQKLFSYNTRASITLASVKGYGYFVLDPLILRILTAEEFKCCPLATINYLDFIQTNVNSVEVAEHIIRFSKQSNYLDFPDLCIDFVCQSKNDDVVNIFIELFQDDVQRLMNILNALFIKSAFNQISEENIDCYKFIVTKIIYRILTLKSGLTETAAIIFDIMDSQDVENYGFIQPNVTYNKSEFEFCQDSRYINRIRLLYCMDCLMQVSEQIQLPFEDLWNYVDRLCATDIIE